jgi:Arc/MetJ family transcription regulator
MLFTPESGRFPALDSHIYKAQNPYIHKELQMPPTLTSIRLDTKLADEAVRVLGVKSRTEAVHVALKEIVGLKEFKKLMKDHGGKLKFENFDR